jgi:hypothetical protein
MSRARMRLMKAEVGLAHLGFSTHYIIEQPRNLAFFYFLDRLAHIVKRRTTHAS